MVLAELGGKLRDALRKLQTRETVTQKELNILLSEITRALIESDVNIKLVLSLRDNIQKKVLHLLDDDKDDGNADNDDDSDDDDDNNKKKKKAIQQHRQPQQNLGKIVQRAVIDELTNLLRPSITDSKGKVTYMKPYEMKRNKTNVILFVGLQGSGKTTTIAKYAHYYQRRNYKVCMVCADTFRAGALDQLKQNATKLRIPFYGNYKESDPVIIANEGVKQFRKDNYDIIIVDTSGRHKQEQSLFNEMLEISNTIIPNNIILVIDATQGQAVYDQALAFHTTIDIGNVIITKLDGHAKGGGALSAVSATNSPISFIGTGEHFDDFDIFYPDSFISKLMGYGDVRGLMDALKDQGGDDKQSKEELIEKMSKGEFTLRDMYKQFEKILNLGPLNKLAGMMPGMPEYLIPKGDDQDATNRLRKFMIMMDSMNNAELDGKVDFSKYKTDPNMESRIRRIAAGSGHHPNEVNMLLQVHRQFEGMVSKMGKSGLMGGGGKKAQLQQQQLAAQLRKNPNLISQRINQMDPQMVKQMGGRDKVMTMMQQFAKSGGANPGMGGGMPGMGGGMPGMGGGMPGMGGGMPNMEAMQAMMQSMGMGGGGGLGGPGAAAGGAGGMDMQALMRMAQAMQGSGMLPPGMQPPTNSLR